MALFEAHISKVQHNLSVLQKINSIQGTLDWQITVCYYTAVHLIDGYLAREANLHFQKHTDVDLAINPMNTLSLQKLPSEIYLHYEKLSNLSRRARYLCSDNPSERQKQSGTEFLVNDKHLRKAIINLDGLISYFINLYKLEFPRIKLHCKEFSMDTQLGYFLINPINAGETE